MQPNIPSSQELYERLRHHKLLESVPASFISDMAEQAKIREWKQGQVIFHQGDPANEVYFVYEGQLRVINVSKSPPRLLNYMHENDFFGELGLIRDSNRVATIDVVVDAIVACFDRQVWESLITTHPMTLKKFKQLSEGYAEHRDVKFQFRQSDEVGILNINRHILVLFIRMGVPLAMFLLGLLLGWLLEDFGIFTPFINYGVIGGFFILLGIILTIYEYIEWVNDDFIVSSKRVIHIERTIIAGEHRDETPLTQINDIEVNTPNFFTRAMGYSNVIIKTAGLGSLKFDGVRGGNEIKEIIMHQVKQAKERVQAADLSSIRKSLADQIGWQGGPLEPEPLEVVDVTEPERPKFRFQLKLPRLLDYYIPHVRESIPQGGVKWRKHIWIWLQIVWLPGLALLGTFYLLLAALVGLFPFNGFNGPMLLGILVLLAFVLLWYTYQHDSWYKDVYIVTDTKIIHQDSTAFRLRGEEIRETTFDHVQTIDYETPTFWTRLISLGNVVIKTAAVGEAFIFEDVFFPRAVQQEVFNRWVKYKEAQRRRERAHEEDRFTTWLGEYHAIAHERQSH